MSLGVGVARVLVFGSRTWRELGVIVRVLADLRPAVVIEGDAQGADRMAGAWARARGVVLERYPADWARDGKAAGPLRNQRMLDEGKPDRAVGFISGAVGSPWSRGSADMAACVKKAGVPYAIYRDGGVPEVESAGVVPGARGTACGGCGQPFTITATSYQPDGRYLCGNCKPPLISVAFEGVSSDPAGAS